MGEAMTAVAEVRTNVAARIERRETIFQPNKEKRK